MPKAMMRLLIFLVCAAVWSLFCGTLMPKYGVLASIGLSASGSVSLWVMWLAVEYYIGDND